MWKETIGSESTSKLPGRVTNRESRHEKREQRDRRDRIIIVTVTPRLSAIGVSGIGARDGSPILPLARIFTGDVNLMGTASMAALSRLSRACTVLIKRDNN